MRGELAEWLVEPGNPYFARSIVNRLWKALMGRGLVEPVNDLRPTNPATHPLLLDRLARDFVEHGFDLRHTLRRVAMSAAFARGRPPGGVADDRYYSQGLVRPLGAEVLADVIADVTGVSDLYGAEPAGTRAVELPDSKISSIGLDLLGRCSREEPCDSDLTGRGLAAQLHLLNGPLLNRKVASAAGRLAASIAAKKPTDTVVEEFYLRALCRLPRQEELTFWGAQLGPAESAERKQRLEDFLWSLLNCQEFQTNH